jgi:hypothetical protein
LGCVGHDHLARRAHAVVLVPVCVGGCDERIFVVTGDDLTA